MKVKKVTPCRNYTARYKLVSNFEETAPKCPHGRTLLFEKIGSQEKFFACSAYRDRKGCPFYLKYDDWNKKKTMVKWSKPLEERPTCMTSRIKEMVLFPRNERRFCATCSQLVRPNELEAHSSHSLTTNVSIKLLTNPSTLLKPLNANKQEAQYHFTRSSVKFFIRTLRRLDLRRVICIGTTSLHEHIQRTQLNTGLKSMLLDIDERFAQFYLKSQFVKFNMFNNHFFDKTGSQRFKKFIRKSKREELILVIDPPFGGLMEALAQTIKQINAMIRMIHDTGSTFSVKVLLFMPYFLEKVVTSSMSDLRMTDYRVDYMNHKKFNSKNGASHSPVRIYTNIAGSEFVLPKSKYKFCSKCERFVSNDQVHCNKCSNCCSKDGRQSVHCDICRTCHKNTWTHCDTCQRCSLPHVH